MKTRKRGKNEEQITFFDSEDLGADRNHTEATRSQIWTRESDVSILDNEPSCEK